MLIAIQKTERLCLLEERDLIFIQEKIESTTRQTAWLRARTAFLSLFSA